jgi:hypothetical protein
MSQPLMSVLAKDMSQGCGIKKKTLVIFLDFISVTAFFTDRIFCGMLISNLILFLGKSVITNLVGTANLKS